MKKIYSTMVMLAMMVAALGLSACGGDDEGTNGLYGSNDFIELTINGQTFYKNLFGIYSEMGIGDNDMVLTASTENVFEDEGFEFFLGLTHSDKKDILLSSSTGNYGVSDNIWHDDNPGYFCLYPIYEKNRNIYGLVNGSHQVTSIKQTKNGVQVCGRFTITMANGSNTVTINGKYGMTVLM